MDGSRKSLLTLLTILASSVTFADMPNGSSPRTFLGPTAHFGIVKGITDDTAFALAGEAGPKNYRASGTIGWEFDFHQRIKATAEYLRQKITYSFYDGNQAIWMGQGAVGLNYQYDFRQVDPFNTLIDVTTYYAHSASKGLGTDTYTNNGMPITVNRRVAGADAYGIAPGISITTIDGTTAGVEVSYDNVQFDTKNRAGLSAKGLGGTVRLAQELTDDIKIGGSAAIRKPFNNYQADITFNNVEYYGIWSLSAFGAYTAGKSAMPSTYNVGVGADYFIDAHHDLTKPEPKSKAPMPQPSKDYKGYKDYKDYKDLPPMVWKDPDVADRDFLNWVSVPAVYIPQVYAVPDDTCVQQPIFSGSIGGGNVLAVSNYVINLNNYFSPSSGLAFTITQDGAPMDPTFYSLVGTTLTIFAPVGPADPYHPNIVITATSGCGSASSNLFDLNFTES